MQFLNCRQKMVLLLKMHMGRLLEKTKTMSMLAQRGFVHICTTPRWEYPFFGLEFEKLM